jgi:DNA repair protein RecO (recombination protein O)
MLTKDVAICIRAIDYSETSQIVTLFTRATGKIGAIAKGSKRPKSSFGGPIEIFSHGKIVFSDPNREKLATLTELESVYGGRGINGLGQNLFALNCCLFGAELLDKFTHNYDPHPQLFDGFLEFLQNTHNAEKNSEIFALLILFQLTLLKEVGLQPVLNACANCKTGIACPELGRREHRVYFCSSANGLICRDCEGSFPDKVSLSRTAANCLSNLKLLEVSNEKTLKEIEGILIHHFTELLGHKPKMAKHVLK